MSHNGAPPSPPSIPVIDLSGEITHVTVQPLSARIAAELGRGRVHLVLDMSQVETLSCGALGALLLQQTDAEQRGGSIKIAAPSGSAHEALRSHGFTAVFDVYESRDGALRALGADTQAA